MKPKDPSPCAQKPTARFYFSQIHTVRTLKRRLFNIDFNIVTYSVFNVTKINGFWIWFTSTGVSITITVNYNSSHTELLLNDVCLTDAI
jgi:hypothetical protein